MKSPYKTKTHILIGHLKDIAEKTLKDQSQAKNKEIIDKYKKGIEEIHKETESLNKKIKVFNSKAKRTKQFFCPQITEIVTYTAYNIPSKGSHTSWSREYALLLLTDEQTQLLNKKFTEITKYVLGLQKITPEAIAEGEKLATTF